MGVICSISHHHRKLQHIQLLVLCHARCQQPWMMSTGCSARSEPTSVGPRDESQGPGAAVWHDSSILGKSVVRAGLLEGRPFWP